VNVDLQGVLTVLVLPATYLGGLVDVVGESEGHDEGKMAVRVREEG
jgi:hypothetical protein